MYLLTKNGQKDLSLVLASIIKLVHNQIYAVEIEPNSKNLFAVFICDIFPQTQIILGLNPLYGLV